VIRSPRLAAVGGQQKSISERTPQSPRLNDIKARGLPSGNGAFGAVRTFGPPDRLDATRTISTVPFLAMDFTAL